MREQGLRIEIDAGVARLTLDRAALHNAFNAALIAELAAACRRLREDDTVRAVVLTGAGDSFSAGGDLNWMRGMAEAGREENRHDALRLAAMFRALDSLPKPVIARVNGAAFGGGVGLICCSDIAFSVRDARFGLTEVRLGLIPATIAPFVQARIGAAGMRRYALTGERFDAEAAQRIGLVHELDDDLPALDRRVDTCLDALRQAAPGAVAECKLLIRKLAGSDWRGDQVDRQTAAWIARQRASDEGRAGLRAFLDKTAPPWAPDRDHG
jgi:methylglutaconyl-CoA hydratase